MSFLPEHIDERLRDEISRHGMVLLDLKRRGERGTTVVEVVVDSEKGVTLDELTALSRFTGALFDEAAEAIPGRYKLEVSSAGLDRPLEHRWQYRKNIGRLLKLTHSDDSGAHRTDLFNLLDLTDEGLVLSPKKAGSKKTAETVTIPWDRVIRAVVEPQF